MFRTMFFSGLVLAACLATNVTGASAEPGDKGAEAAGTTSVPSTKWPFDGLLEITAVNSASKCSVTAGDIFISVYRPKYDSTDTKPAGLTVMSKRNGFVMQDKSAGQKFSGGGSYDVSGISSRGYSYSKTGAGNYSLVVTTDTASFATMKTVSITGTITNFWSDTGCTATIRGVYQRRAN